jgi:glycosyltransferase involved in cell wall biosynthesis
MHSRKRPIRRARILIIVQNLPVPLDRRVWLECQALTAAGYQVSVICPKGPGDPRYHVVDGVHLYKYAPPLAACGAVGYLFEFVYCWLRTALLSLRVLRRNGFDVIQACNPPDTYWLLARLYKPFGKKFVYDQHDLNPEVFRSRFGEPKRTFAKLQYRLLLWLERRTFLTADRVISTNESYRRIAVERGAVPIERTTVVRSGPCTARMRPIDGVPDLREGRSYLLVYLGIMNPQDGVDLVVRVMDVLVNVWQRDDVHAALLGFGDSFDELVELTHQLGLEDHITFTGRVGPSEIARYLSSAHIGLSPDPLSPLNDVSTMNKTMEYMSFALPVVSFDLVETRVSGSDAVHYLPATDVVDDRVIEDYAGAVVKLLDDPRRRADMALSGRRRAEAVLDWAPQRRAYLSVFDDLTGRVSPEPADEVLDADLARALGGTLVDVSDDDQLRAFGMTRSLTALEQDVDAVQAGQVGAVHRFPSRVVRAGVPAVTGTGKSEPVRVVLPS